MSEFCTVHWEGSDLPSFYKVMVILNIVLSVTATLGNSVILVALANYSSIHAPSKMLLSSLTVTDLCVGAISQPLVVTLLLSALKESWNLCQMIEYSLPVTTTVFSGVSLTVLTAIGLDRLLALTLKFRYRQIVTVERARRAVLVFWIKSGMIGALHLASQTLLFTVGVVLILLDVFISSYSYIRIFFAIRRQQAQVQVFLQTGNNTPNIARYRRSVFNALWAHVTLAICYTPFAVVTVVIVVRGSSTLLTMARFSTLSLVYMNSSLNPALYCWRIKEVRQAVKQTIRQLPHCISF